MELARATISKKATMVEMTPNNPIARDLKSESFGWRDEFVIIAVFLD